MAIDLYTWSTPNGYKVSIMLEEVGLEYAVHLVDIRHDEQFAPAFLAVSPNNKIPAIVDDGLPVFDSGAILVYLAEKTGQLLPTQGASRTKVLQWLMFQMAHVGPMLGQLAWFTRNAQLDLPIQRYTAESVRLLRVMEAQLERSEFIAGDYSIADIALFPWAALAIEPIEQTAGDQLGEVPALKRWMGSVGVRPAVSAGMHIPEPPA